jgi:23S rRNA (uracil1939-C5)-methyltransferase
VNEIIELEIQDVAFGGAGVGRHVGKVYFVPFTAPGERVRVRVRKAKKKFAEAELLEVLNPSPERIAAPCPYFGRCGGCAYQHLPYERQLALKQAQVEQTLRRVGRLDSVPMDPIIPSALTYGFRNRIRVHVQDGQAGFFAQGSHALVPIERCIISKDEVNDALHRLRRTPVSDGDYTLSGPGRGPFFEQTNDDVAAKLLKLVESWMQPDSTLLVDAYCGAGFFAHHLATRFQQVIGIEENEHAIAHAKRRAGSNERYVAGDVAMLLGDVLFGHDPAKTTVIVDPPAAGLAPRVVEMLAARPPAELVYVSCDPATLARDLGVLSKRLKIEAVRPLDMFPQTAEVEVAVRLKRADYTSDA